MRNQRILNVFGQIDEKYIEEAAPVTQKTGRNTIWRIGSFIAACAAIIIYAGIQLMPFTSQEPMGDSTTTPPVVTDNLPLLVSRFESDGMGFEGLMYYDISEADNANPWTAEGQLTTLPVYRNLAYTDEAGAPTYLSEEEMQSLAEHTATALNTTIENTEYTPYSLTAVTHLGEILVSGNGEISIFFSEPIALPAEYSFTHSDTSHEDALNALHYLTERFSALVKFSDPVMETGVDYTFSGEQTRYYRVYESNSGLEEQILNYNFNSVSFSPDDEGNLWIIRLRNILESSEKLGDYPLITLDTAQKLLLAKEYITTVPDEYLSDGIVKEKHIAKVELVYRSGNINQVFMPYYRFYVELTEFDSTSIKEGLKNYGIYYVPAVSGEYLSDFPAWDGSFN